MPSTTRTRTAAAAALLAAAVLTGCSDTANGDPTTTTTSTTSTSSTTTSTSSTTTEAEPTDEEKAADAVIGFYKELDLVAAGKARLDSFKYATDDGVDPTGTLGKWQGLLSNQLLLKGVQVGTTKISDLSVQPGDTQEIGPNTYESWVVLACVDRTGIHLEDKAGEVVPSDGGQETAIITHVVIDSDDDFMVLRDDPGKSC